jgi:hypothetical protein
MQSCAIPWFFGIRRCSTILLCFFWAKIVYSGQWWFLCLENLPRFARATRISICDRSGQRLAILGLLSAVLAGTLHARGKAAIPEGMAAM